MELMRLVLLLCLATQAPARPVSDYEPQDGGTDGSVQEPTIVALILAANKKFNFIEYSRGVPMLLREGDIAYNSNRNARKCISCKWPKNRTGIVQVPYTLSPKYSASEVTLINNALKEFEVMTCVQFVNHTIETNYLSIEQESGCWSYIGRILGKQTVSLSSPDCMVYGIVQHEAMHNIGFYHEHIRFDRDDYINILWQNMDKSDWVNFSILDTNTLNLPYDYESVMHYPRDSYSSDPSLDTIVPKPDPNVPIGQRYGMSTLDVMKINAYYSCNLCREKLVTASGSLSGKGFDASQTGGNCLWLIQLPSAKVLLHFDSLDISSTDYIKVYDGVTKSSPVLLEITRRLGPILPLLSSGQNMLVEFVSTATSDFSTFSASYVTVTGKLGTIY